MLGRFNKKDLATRAKKMKAADGIELFSFTVFVVVCGSFNGL